MLLPISIYLVCHEPMSGVFRFTHPPTVLQMFGILGIAVIALALFMSYVFLAVALLNKVERSIGHTINLIKERRRARKCRTKTTRQ